MTGAGDTALAMITYAMANNLEMEVCVRLANLAASIAIERIGCAPISLAEVAERYLEFHLESKIFDEDHLYALIELLKNHPFNLLCIDPEQPLLDILDRVKEASSSKKLILYCPSESADERLLSFLSSLQQVDFVILRTESLAHLTEMIHPDEIFPLEKGSLISSKAI